MLMQRIGSAGPAAMLMALAITAFIPAVTADWIWDDDDYVVDNTTLRSMDGLRRIWFAPGATPQY